jgi:hypothetical protein
MGTEPKSNKTVYIISVVLIIVAFFGGMMYGKYGVSSGGNGNYSANGGQAGTYAGRAGRGGANGGAGLTSGDILSMDDKSLTLQLRSGGSKLVFLSASTTVQKQTEGSRADLTVGETVTAIGSPNPDGSITAQSIQIRPAGMPGR